MSEQNNNLTEKELELLMLCCNGRDRFLGLTFGPGFVRLNDTAENEWARTELKKIRSTP